MFTINVACTSAKHNVTIVTQIISNLHNGRMVRAVSAFTYNHATGAVSAIGNGTPVPTRKSLRYARVAAKAAAAQHFSKMPVQKLYKH